MLIGIPKETQKGEQRVALIPKHVKLLVKDNHTVLVERSAGIRAGFPDRLYRAAGADIVADVSSCKMIVSVKPPLLSSIKKHQIMMAYLHIDKGQNPRLLNALLRKEVTAYAYEEIRGKSGRRLINLGYDAGLIGMYLGLRLYGKNLEKHGKRNFLNLPQARRNNSLNSLLEKVKKLRGAKLNVVVMGKGNVSRGVQRLCKAMSVKPQVLWRDKTPFIEEYIPEADILVNAVVWKPGEPHIIRRSVLKLFKSTALILDISCDKRGAVETCKPHAWTEPPYTVRGVLHYCAFNIPSALPKSSSEHLSKMIVDSVRKVANNVSLDTGLMTEGGVFVYNEFKNKRNKKKKSQKT